MRNTIFDVVLVAALATLLIAGCAGRPTLIPPSDKELRKTSTQFAADAARRHPYKAEAPRGGEAIARAQVGYTLDRIDVENLSDDAWNDVEIWVNQNYVCHLNSMPPKKLVTINFQMLYDDKGNYFPTDNKKVLVNKVEMYRDGKMYEIPVRLGD